MVSVCCQEQSMYRECQVPSLRPGKAVDRIGGGSVAALGGVWGPEEGSSLAELPTVSGCMQCGVSLPLRWPGLSPPSVGSQPPTSSGRPH